MITVFGVPTPREALATNFERPERAGSLWQGVPHQTLANRVVESLEKRGAEVIKEKWSVDKSGYQLVGGVLLNLPHVDKIEGQNYALGLQHSNDTKRAIKLSCGSEVMACNNGVLTGSFILTRRHTTGVNLEEEVEKGADRFFEEAMNVKQVIDDIKAVKITTRRKDHILMNAGRDGLLPWSHLGYVDKEYINPTTACFKEWKNSGWGLYNAFNEVIKRSSPMRQLESLNGFRELVLN